MEKLGKFKERLNLWRRGIKSEASSGRSSTSGRGHFGARCCDEENTRYIMHTFSFFTLYLRTYPSGAPERRACHGVVRRRRKQRDGGSFSEETGMCLSVQFQPFDSNCEGHRYFKAPIAFGLIGEGKIQFVKDHRVSTRRSHSVSCLP